MVDVLIDKRLMEDRAGWLTADATVVFCTAADLMLDNPARRGHDGGRHRRALVHDQTDGLTINYNKDYPGGVTLNAVAKITPKAGGHRINPLKVATIAELQIEGGVSFLWDYGHRVGAPPTEVVSLQELLQDLMDRVLTLEQK